MSAAIQKGESGNVTLQLGLFAFSIHSPAEMDLQRLSILVAEPDPLVSQTISEMLKAGEHYVCMAASIDIALRWLERVSADVLVISLDEDFSSASMLSVIRASQPSVKMIGITINSGQVPKATIEWIDALLHKPISINQFEEVLIRVVQGRQTCFANTPD